MVAFTAFSEAAIAEFALVSAAVAYMPGTESTATAGDIGVAAETNLASSTAIISAGSLGVAAQTTLNSVSASTNTQFEKVNLTVTPVSVTASLVATTTINDSSYILTAKPTVLGNSVNVVNNSLVYDAKGNTPALTGVYLNINNYALTDEDAQATTTVSGVSATTTANWDTVNGVYAVNVIFSNTDFERSRTVNIVPYGNYKVYITR